MTPPTTDREEGPLGVSSAANDEHVDVRGPYGDNSVPVNSMGLVEAMDLLRGFEDADLDENLEWYAGGATLDGWECRAIGVLLRGLRYFTGLPAAKDPA